MVARITEISVMQAGKVMAALYTAFAIVYSPVFILLAIISSDVTALVGLCGLIIFPIMGFIGGIILAWIYNLIVSFVGGFEVTMETDQP